MGFDDMADIMREDKTLRVGATITVTGEYHDLLGDPVVFCSEYEVT